MSIPLQIILILLPTIEVTFEVETSGSYSVRCNFNCTTPGGFSGCGFVALNSSDGSFSKTFSECTLNLLYLNPGTYTLSAEIADGEAEIEFDIFKVETDELAHEREENRVSGGLRIKAVRRDDGNGIPIVKKYFYTDQMGEGINSTGRNFYQNDFKETYTYVDGSYENLGCYGENGATGYIRLKAKSNVPLGYKSSYNVGYKEVTVWHGENGEFGKEHHLYTPSGSGRLLSQYSHRNMAPVEQSYFTGNNRLVKKVHYDYETRRDLSNRVLGLEVETDKKSPCWKCRHTEYSTYTFEYDSEWFKLIKKTEITYPIDEGDNTPFEVVTDYVYDPDQEYDNPKTIITQNSDGTLSKQHFYYAYSCDDSTYGSNLLRDKHMHSQLLKKEIEVDGAIVSKTETYFSDEDESAEGYNIVPTKVINYPKGGDEGIKINYDFDEEGNIIEVQRENDIYHSYVWGYNNTLPVFKIINAPYSLVESKLTAYKSILEGYPTKENIKEIWQHLSDQLPEDVQIMGYGFEPLKGMNMAIDINGNPSYFDYDDFNRLQYVKDYDEKLLQKYEYHYIKN
ncbi:hypothetical protein [Flexithrix dorotheae]|uniref:hypothetical protein n=1 Tax=Flexithrix dorotheae TaxID=70993 RepID=UPI0012FAE24D|nr:hypothetical protein [Flexithrix dorotheae]